MSLEPRAKANPPVVITSLRRVLRTLCENLNTLISTIFHNVCQSAPDPLSRLDFSVGAQREPVSKTQLVSTPEHFSRSAPNSGAVASTPLHRRGTFANLGIALNERYAGGAAMKFGLFYEISVPRPWGPDTEKKVYDNCIEQVRLADELGFSSVWAVEHHFLEEYSHCSAPEVFLTACAMLTKQIRVGHGIVVCVPEFNHPIRIAERCAVMDIVSGGRLNVGTGRSATWTELGGFRANPDETKKTWDEFVHCLPKMWTEERFSYQGRSWSMPQRAILPKPYQKPHPPMWVAVTSPGTEIDAAERGMGSLGLTFGGFQEQEEKVNRYRKLIRNCEPVGQFINENVTTVNFLFCHEEDRVGVATGRRLTGMFNYHAAQLVAAREAFPGKSYPSLGLLPQLRREAAGPGDETGAPEGIAIGSPARLVRELKKWESVGVDCVNFLLNAVETVPQEQVLASLRLFAKEVMPHFEKAGDSAIAAAGAS